MQNLTEDYSHNTKMLDGIFGVDSNFDMIKKSLAIGKDSATLYYIDGFVKDTVMQNLMIYLLSLNGLGDESPDNAEKFAESKIPYVEVSATDDTEVMIRMVLSGASLMLGSTFGSSAIIIDSRSYPARSTAEPDDDRVMKGAKDGFVETLIFNTALIRRRVRNPSLVMSYMSIGKSSKTDVVVCYMKDRADPGYVENIKSKLRSINTESLTMGHESLAECLIHSKWYNPFPKIRSTGRPDAAAAQLLEGNVLIICDNSPEVMILPSTIFDFLQETNDFYFPPLTGSYLRIIRHIVFWLTLLLVPTWYLLIMNSAVVPAWFDFVLPQNHGRLPILAQILLVEFIIDGLKMASMNTPDMLSNSLSVVAGLILGDFAVQIGWLIPEVILYMAFVAIANFTQRNYELGYAFKYMRIIILILTALFNIWGYIGGFVLTILLLSSNKTVNGKRNYLYPLIPFNAKALKSMLIRVRKRDV